MNRKRKNIFGNIFSHPGIFFKDGEGEGGKGSGEGEGENKPVTFTQEQFDAKIAEITAANKDTADQSLKAKNQELLTKLTEAKTRANAFGDLDPENVKNMFKQFEQNEELKLISEGKHEEVIHKRVEKKEAEFESTVKGLNEKLEALTKENLTAKEQVKTLLIDSSIVSEFISQGGSKDAIEDIKYRAKAVFDVEDGVAVPRNDKGELLVGKTGTMTQQEWVANLKETAKHLFSPSQGAGGTGNRGEGHSNPDVDTALKQGDREGFRKARREQRSSSSSSF